MAIKWTFHYDFLNDIYSGVNCFYPNIINFWPLISEYVCLLRWRAKTFEGADLGIFVFCLTPWEWARVLYCKYAGLGLLTVSSSISSVVISNMSINSFNYTISLTRLGSTHGKFFSYFPKFYSLDRLPIHYHQEVTFLSILSSDILTIVTRSESETSNLVAIGLTKVHEF